MKVLKSLKRFIPMAATLAVAVSFGAHAQEKKGVTESELKYQAGASPLAGEAMYQSSNPKAATACCARARPASR